MPRQIVGSDQFAPNAIVFPLGGEAFMIYCVHPTASDFPHGRRLAAARKGILLTVFGFRARLANRQIAAIVRQAFQCGNRRLALVAVSHRYKSESTGRAAHAIGHHLHISYDPIRREEIAQSCSVVENDRLPTYNFISFFSKAAKEPFPNIGFQITT